MNETWTVERMARLTELWLDGVSARLIAIEMGLGKNAVVGKAHRLKLPGRGSPIRYGGQKGPKRKVLTAPTEPANLTMPLPAQESEAPVCLERDQCQFIAGERGVDFKLYVDAPRCPDSALPGSPYCGGHHLRCHAKSAARVMKALIAKLEHVAEGNREISDRMLRACGWYLQEDKRLLREQWLWLAPGNPPFLVSGDPDPTCSLDAAINLVPEGRASAILIYENGRASAAIGEPPQFGDHEAPTAALALCIAIMRARQMMEAL